MAAVYTGSHPLWDIFSLGVVLYEMLSGIQPFRRATMAEVLTATLREDPDPLPENVPLALRQIAERCLEKVAAKRFQSAVDLAYALRSNTTGTAPIAPAKPSNQCKLPAIAAASLTPSEPTTTTSR